MQVNSPIADHEGRIDYDVDLRIVEQRLMTLNSPRVRIKVFYFVDYLQRHHFNPTLRTCFPLFSLSKVDKTFLELVWKRVLQTGENLVDAIKHWDPRRPEHQRIQCVLIGGPLRALAIADVQALN